MIWYTGTQLKDINMESVERTEYMFVVGVAPTGARYFFQYESLVLPFI